MDWILPMLVLLACPLGCGLAALLLGRGRSAQHGRPGAPSVPSMASLGGREDTERSGCC